LSLPAIEIDGSYFVDWKQNRKDELVIEWNGSPDQATGCQIVSKIIDDMVPLQDRLVLDSRCYQTR
jgi:hypothetical protein